MLRSLSAMLATLGLFLSTQTHTLAQTSTPTAQTTGWDLRKSIDHALQNNLQVRQVGLSVEQAAVDVRQARANQLPSLNGNGSHGFNNGFFLDPVRNEIQNTQVWSGNFSLQSNVNLYSGLQVQNTIKRNKIDLQASQLDQAKAQNDIILNVVTAYMTILLNQELLKTNQERLNLTQSQLDRTQKLFKAGSVPESNVLDLNAQMASDELNIITAQNQIELAELNLIQLLNLENASPDNFSILVPDLPNPDQTVISFDAQDVYSTAETVMPEIKRAQLRVESAMKSIEIARGAYHPSLSLVGNISSRYSSSSYLISTGGVSPQRTFLGFQDESMSTPFFLYGPAQSRYDYPYLNQLSDNVGQFIGLSLNVPILNAFRTRNNLQLSRINLRNAQLNAEIARNDLKRNIAQAYADVIGAQRRYSSAKKQLEAFEQAFKNAEIRLDNGLINSVDFNVARNNLIKAQSDIIQAKYDFIFKLKILEFYQGKTITL